MDSGELRQLMIRDWKEKSKPPTLLFSQVIQLDNWIIPLLPQKVEAIRSEAVLSRIYGNRGLASCGVLVAAQFTTGKELVTVRSVIMRDSDSGSVTGKLWSTGSKVYEIQT